MSNWLVFDDPRFEVRFRYPSVTPGGEQVGVTESQQGDVLRILVRCASREAYVELVRFPPMPAEAE